MRGSELGAKTTPQGVNIAGEFTIVGFSLEGGLAFRLDLCGMSKKLERILLGPFEEFQLASGRLGQMKDPVPPGLDESMR
jgi:hypothetical protein